MKIIEKEIKECNRTNGDKELVLDITYTHRGETGRILIRDYDSSLEEETFKILRKQVRNLYAEQILKTAI